MSKFKLNSEYEGSEMNRKKHSSKKHFRENDDYSDFAYMSRGAAKNEIRHLKEEYGF